MAINQQPPQGGLAQVAPRQAPAQQPKENLAARAASMEQEEPTQPQDYFTKSIEDLRKQREALNQQITSLRSSLDQRMGLPFDPTLMAAAAGFLKPTKTGSFGESLGYATEGMASAAEKDWARKQAMSKLGLELGEKQLALATKGLESEDLMRLSGMGGMAPGAPKMPAPGGLPGGPAGGPVGGPVGGPAAPQAAAPEAPQAAPIGATGRSGAPNQMRLISDSDIARAYSISKEYGDKIANLAKIQREDVKDIGGRPYSTSRQQFLPGDPNKPVEYDFGRYIGTKKTTQGTVEEYERIHKEALEKNDPNIEFNWFKRKGWLEGKIQPTKGEMAPGQPAAAAEGEPLSLEERERRGKLREKREEADITEEKQDISKMRSNATNARELANTARDTMAYATSNPRAFQLLQNANLRDAILRAIEKGISTPGGSISLPTRELETYKLSNEDREALMMFMNASARQTVMFRKTARAPGEGATTESEGALYAQLGTLPSDTARVIIMKSDALLLKAEYDRQLFRTWNKYKKENQDASYADFLTSKEHDALNDAYDEQIAALRKRNSDILGTAPKAPEAKKPQAASKAAGYPRITGDNDPVYLNLKPGDLFIAPDGTVKTKR